MDEQISVLIKRQQEYEFMKNRSLCDMENSFMAQDAFWSVWFLPKLKDEVNGKKRLFFMHKMSVVFSAAVLVPYILMWGSLWIVVMAVYFLDL